MTFCNVRASISFINAGSYVQTVFGDARRSGRIDVERAPTSFEVLIWMHCICTVAEAVSKDKMTLRSHFRNGNIIGFVVQKVCMAWELLYRRVHNSTDPLEDHILPYVCYSPVKDQVEHLEPRSGFSSTTQKHSLVPQMHPAEKG